MVATSDTSKGSGPESWTTLPPSMKIFSTFISLITALYLHDRSPKPLSWLQVQLMPMPRVNAQLPSGRSFTFWKLPGLTGFESDFFVASSLRPWSRPHFLITKASFTDKQYTSSIPQAFIASYASSYPGRWIDEQVGVKAPGRENKTTLFPLNRSLEDTSFHPNSRISPYNIFRDKENTETHIISKEFYQRCITTTVRFKYHYIYRNTIIKTNPMIYPNTYANTYMYKKAIYTCLTLHLKTVFGTTLPSFA